MGVEEPRRVELDANGVELGLRERSHARFVATRIVQRVQAAQQQPLLLVCLGQLYEKLESGVSAFKMLESTT